MVKVYFHMIYQYTFIDHNSSCANFTHLFALFFFFFGPFDLWERGGDGRCVGETGEMIAYVAVVHTNCSLQHATHRFLASWEGCGFVSKIQKEGNYRNSFLLFISFCTNFINDCRTRTDILNACLGL